MNNELRVLSESVMRVQRLFKEHKGKSILLGSAEKYNTILK